MAIMILFTVLLAFVLVVVGILRVRNLAVRTGTEIDSDAEFAVFAGGPALALLVLFLLLLLSQGIRGSNRPGGIQVVHVPTDFESLHGYHSGTGRFVLTHMARP